MALSGTEKTRIGASLSGVGIKLTITAKAEGVAFVVPDKRSINAVFKDRDLIAEYKDRDLEVI